MLCVLTVRPLLAAPVLQDAKRKEREERERAAAERRQRLEAESKRRKEAAKPHRRVTKRGQPLMKARLEGLLSKLEKQL